MTDQATLDFLRESNAIEAVYDEQSLEDAKAAWAYLLKQYKLSREVLLECHKILMHRHLREAGSYRYVQVYVGEHIPPAPELVLPLMEDWFAMQGAASTEEGIKAAHVRFETIHPFVDGNGRIGRMLLNWQRVKSGLPILVIWEKDRQEYYKWFKS